MSAVLQPSLNLHHQNVLGELLHCLSQPLTTLRCSLELSIDKPAEPQHEAVAAALEQAENVINMVQLMREYLDAEQSPSQAESVRLAPVLRALLNDLGPIAALRGVKLRLAGTCSVALPLSGACLRLALDYLVSTSIESLPAGGEITFLLAENRSESVLLVTGDSPSFSRTGYAASHDRHSPVVTLRRMKLAIAHRMLETAGARLDLDEGELLGFVLRIPRQPVTPALAM